jgi:two-component system chemotaxis response regulator CheY
MMKVLIVDDSKTMRNIERKTMAALGDVECVDAGDGVEALKCIEEHKSFDLVIIDWNMPNMDGITLIAKIRETDKRTPLVMCTTEAEKTRVMEAIKAGANNYVVKPFTPESLLDRIRQTLEKAKAAA